MPARSRDFIFSLLFLLIGVTIIAKVINWNLVTISNAFYDRAVDSLKAGDIDTAQKILEISAERFPKNPLTHRLLGDFYVFRGSYGRAVVEFEKALAQNSNDAWIYWRLGEIYWEKYDLDKSMVYLQKALEVSPDFVYAKQSLGRLYFYKKDYDQAIELYGEVLAVDPKNARALHGLAESYYLESKYDLAIEKFNELIGVLPDKPDIYRSNAFDLLARSYAMSGQFEDAVRMYERLTEINPNNPFAFISLANLYMQLGKYDQSIEILERIRVCYPNYRYVYESLGESYVQAGDWLKAKDVFLELLALVPGHRIAENRLNYLRYSAKNINEKINKFLDKNKQIKAELVENFVILTDINKINIQQLKKELCTLIPLLCRQYLIATPDYPIKIVALQEKKEYDELVGALRFVFDKNSYGHALIGMNYIIINFTPGVLLHEMMHLLIRQDLGIVPFWIDEGFASLYESVEIEDKKLRGIVNWRLRSLKKYIALGNDLDLLKLLREDIQFVRQSTEEEVSVVRHLMLYLQEKEMLFKFYRAYKKNKREDFYGINTLEKVIGVPLEEFKDQWFEWVKQL